MLRTLFCLIVVSLVLAACGNRTPLMLPKPDAKPPASQASEPR
jgi:predicted small lipoprotein YifL